MKRFAVRSSGRVKRFSFLLGHGDKFYARRSPGVASATREHFRRFPVVNRLFGKIARYYVAK